MDGGKQAIPSLAMHHACCFWSGKENMSEEKEETNHKVDCKKRVGVLQSALVRPFGSSGEEVCVVFLKEIMRI